MDAGMIILVAIAITLLIVTPGSPTRRGCLPF